MHGLFQFLSFMLQNGEWVSCKFDLQKEVAKPAQNTRGLSPEVWSLLASESHDEQRHFETVPLAPFSPALRPKIPPRNMFRLIHLQDNWNHQKSWMNWIETFEIQNISPVSFVSCLTVQSITPHIFSLGGLEANKNKNKNNNNNNKEKKTSVLFVFIQNMLLQSKGLSLQWIFLPRKKKKQKVRLPFSWTCCFAWGVCFWSWLPRVFFP